MNESVPHMLGARSPCPRDSLDHGHLPAAPHAVLGTSGATRHIRFVITAAAARCVVATLGLCFGCPTPVTAAPFEAKAKSHLRIDFDMLSSQLTDDEREQMSNQTNASFDGRTADQLLMLIDAYEDTERDESNEHSIVAGPFSAFKLPGPQALPSLEKFNSEINQRPSTPSSTAVSEQPYQADVQYILEHPDGVQDIESSLLNFEGGAEVPDLMDMVAMVLPQLAPNNFDLPTFDQGPFFILQDSVGSDRPYVPPVENFMPRPQAPLTHNMNIPWPEDVGVLFRYYEANVITPSASFFKSRKSPWRVILLPGATQTYTGLAVWNHVSETRMAMFYSLLAISAFHLNKTRPNDVTQHWRKRGLEAQRLAKKHLQLALQGEIQGPPRGKYKDLLMTILAMAMASALDDAQNIRNFLLDAERLIRIRGIPKPKKSQKVLLLHHTYTHLRIMVESVCSMEYLESFNHASQPNLPSQNAYSLRNFQLAEERLNLGLDPSSPKDDDEGYNDIHLETQGNWQKTMYPFLYALPESLTTLLSQTLSLANAKPQLDRIALINPKTAAALAEHTFDLERNIWNWTLPSRTDSPLSPDISGSEYAPGINNGDMDREEIKCVALAFHQAICIYFYRRIYKVYPRILQTAVAQTLEYLGPCMRGGSEERDFGTSLTCEAMTPELQEKSLEYLSRFDQKGSFWAPWQAVRIVKEVWKRREEREQA
ncbi:unnamed protein product [Clonostachys rosea]|uniref:Transcription factor domain-containing protein n=1 Tax=Bionectria ochroleuca TaxID=29856 RepID=A0ABY6UKE9_BIOOC|nr:unnamed protein product [Clonostachys rosea]